MPEIRLTVDENFINNLKKDTGLDKATQVTSDALTLLRWAVDEVKKGRVLISTDENGGEARRIVMPTLEMAKAKKRNKNLQKTLMRQPQSKYPSKRILLIVHSTRKLSLLNLLRKRKKIIEISLYK